MFVFFKSGFITHSIYDHLDMEVTQLRQDVEALEEELRALTRSRSELRAKNEELSTEVVKLKSQVTQEKSEKEHKRQLYKGQQEKVSVLETVLKECNPSISNQVVDASSAAMADARKFCITALHEVEKEKQEWRTRCLSAEAMCKSYEEYLGRTELTGE